MTWPALVCLRVTNGDGEGSGVVMVVTGSRPCGLCVVDNWARCIKGLLGFGSMEHFGFCTFICT